MYELHVYVCEGVGAFVGTYVRVYLYLFFFLTDFQLQKYI